MILYGQLSVAVTKPKHNPLKKVYFGSQSLHWGLGSHLLALGLGWQFTVGEYGRTNLFTVRTQHLRSHNPLWATPPMTQDFLFVPSL